MSTPEPRIRPAAKALILKDGRFLVIKEVIDGKDIWDLPGGKIEYGESAEETVLREVKEEVGLDVDVERCIGYYWFIREGDGMQIVALAFQCQSTNTEVDLTKNPAKENITEHHWVTAEAFQSPSYDAADTLKALLKHIR
ncbi:MAG: NUDIX hydrolase [bacterium]|nr:NUDIX hydrolase [bacterium]